MTWLNPWVSRVGIVSRVEITPPFLPGGPFITRFRLDGHSVQYHGKPALLCDGDRVIVVGWQHKGELHACFLAMPDWGWYFRRHSAVSDFVGGILLLVLAGLLIAKVAILPGFLLVGIAAMPIFHAIAWLEGEQLMRRVTLASYQPRPGS